MKKAAKRMLRATVGACPYRVLSSLFGNQPFIGLYHIVSDSELAHVRHLYPSKGVEDFERDLIYLKKHFDVISYEDLVSAVGSNGKLSPRSALVTFDDGYRECYSVVRPLLKKHGIPCMFFVTTDFVGNRNMFFRNKVSLCIDQARTLDDSSWSTAADALVATSGVFFNSVNSFARWINLANKRDEATIDSVCRILDVDVDAYLTREKPYVTVEQIQEMARDGFTIGGHTQSHPRLEQCTPDTITDEIVQSCKFVQDWTAQEKVPFAFPFTRGNVDMHLLEGIVRDHSFVRLLFGTSGLVADSPFLLNRVALDHPSESTRSSISSVLRGEGAKLLDTFSAKHRKHALVGS